MSDPKLMLDRLADAIAAATSLARAGAMWSHDVDESAAADPYTVLRLYPGPSIGGTGIDVVSVQALTRAKVIANGWTQSQAVWNSLRENTGRGRLEWQLVDFKIKGITDIRGPGQIGRDERGRVEIVTNFNVAFIATPSGIYQPPVLIS